jgi:hypothetical protein
MLLRIARISGIENNVKNREYLPRVRHRSPRFEDQCPRNALMGNDVPVKTGHRLRPRSTHAGSVETGHWITCGAGKERGPYGGLWFGAQAAPAYGLRALRTEPDKRPDALIHRGEEGNRTLPQNPVLKRNFIRVQFFVGVLPFHPLPLVA